MWARYPCNVRCREANTQHARRDETCKSQQLTFTLKFNLQRHTKTCSVCSPLPAAKRPENGFIAENIFAHTYVLRNNEKIFMRNHVHNNEKISISTPGQRALCPKRTPAPPGSAPKTTPALFWLSVLGVCVEAQG